MICKWLHAPHMGIEKTLARARLHVFWPGMTKDISEIVKDCMVCEKFKRSNQKEPLLQDEKPEYPFHKVSVDIFDYAGRSFLALIDSYSGFLCSELLSDKTASSVIKILNAIFCRYGYPTEIRCDNVPFNSEICDKFANDYNLRFVFSSPRYPQSNGLAEKGVAIAKNLLKRCLEEGAMDMYQLRLLEYNATPVAGMKLPPAQLFFGRIIKTGLPIDAKLLHRNNLEESVVQDRIDQKRKNQRKYYDQHAKPLPVLNEGESVMFKKNGKEWHYGSVVRKVNDRSYIVEDNFNNYYRRNRRFISKTKNNEIDPSELLLEEHLLNRLNSPNNNIIILPSESGDRRDDSARDDDLTESDQVDTNSNSASFYDTASDGSGPFEGFEQQETREIPTEGPKQTRSGRLVKPPQLYGEWTV